MVITTSFGGRWIKVDGDRGPLPPVCALNRANDGTGSDGIHNGLLVTNLSTSCCAQTTKKEEPP